MFHSSNPSLFGRPHEVLAETQALSATLSELRRACDSLSGKDSNAIVATMRILSQLATHLSVCLDTRAHRGYFEAIAEECPSLEESITMLASGRDRLRDSVAWTQRLADHCTQANTPLFGRHVRHLIDTITGHEDAERELLRQFFLRAGERHADVRGRES